MCVQGSQKCPGLKKLLRRTMVRRSTTPTRPMESHAAQSDVARRGIPSLYGGGNVGSSAARDRGCSPIFRSARRNSRVHGRPRQSGGAKHACPGLFQRPRNSRALLVGGLVIALFRPLITANSGKQCFYGSPARAAPLDCPASSLAAGVLAPASSRLRPRVPPRSTRRRTCSTPHRSMLHCVQWCVPLSPLKSSRRCKREHP